MLAASRTARCFGDVARLDRHDVPVSDMVLAWRHQEKGGLGCGYRWLCAHCATDGAFASRDAVPEAVLALLADGYRLALDAYLDGGEYTLDMAHWTVECDEHCGGRPPQLLRRWAYETLARCQV